jgi:hypothetical protein
LLGLVLLLLLLLGGAVAVLLRLPDSRREPDSKSSGAIRADLVRELALRTEYEALSTRASDFQTAYEARWREAREERDPARRKALYQEGLQAMARSLEVREQQLRFLQRHPDFPKHREALQRVDQLIARTKKLQQLGEKEMKLATGEP